MIYVTYVENEVMLEKMYEIRRKVFIEEQGVEPGHEIDCKDEKARHLLGFCDGEVAGCARLRTVDGMLKIERLAVIKEYRRRGVASAILKFISEIPLEDDEKRVFMNAQYHLKDYYAKFGFVAEGEPFLEAGIKHIAMYRR